MDQNLLLSAERLTLSPDIQRGCVHHDTFVIKNVPAAAYLRVSKDQASVLQSFATGSTVPEAFASLLKNRLCLPVREFYELVVKAHQAGILHSPNTRRPVRQAMRWPGLRAGFLLWPTVLMMVAALTWLAVRAPLLTGGWGPLMIGLGAALAALSIGRMLSASIMVGFGGEVYPCKSMGALIWVHGRWDLSDTRLLKPAEQALVTVVENLPLTLCLLATLWWFPSTAASVAAVWLLAWRPWGAGLPRRLANLLSRYPHLDTDTRFLFLPNQRPQLHWRPWWRRWDWRVCAIELAWAAGWALLVARIVLGALGLSFVEVATDWS
jgi:hypothetical protein